MSDSLAAETARPEPGRQELLEENTVVVFVQRFRYALSGGPEFTPGDSGGAVQSEPAGESAVTGSPVLCVPCGVSYLRTAAGGPPLPPWECSGRRAWRAGPRRCPDAACISKQEEELGQDGGGCGGEQLCCVLEPSSLSRVLGFVWGRQMDGGPVRTRGARYYCCECSTLVTLISKRMGTF